MIYEIHMLAKFLMFSSVFLLFTFIVFRIIVKRDYKDNMKLSPVSYVLEILVFASHVNSIYLILPTEWPNIPEMPENQVLKIISILIFCSGLLMLLFSWLNLGTKSSLGMDSIKLKVGGLYQYSRNPQLLGYGLMLIAFVFLYFSFLILLWFLLYVLISSFMIKSEEEFLKEKYKAKYREYCLRVPRILKFKK